MAGPIERLLEEHALLKRMIEVIPRMCDRLKEGQEVSHEHLDQLLCFFKTFADKFHHEKEEKALFPEIESVSGPAEGGPVEVMLKEHTMMRGCIERMEKAIERFKGGNPRAASMIVQNAINHNELLGMHISKEENMLFPMAKMHLSQDQMDEVMKKFDALDSERPESENLDAFQKILAEIEIAFAPQSDSPEWISIQSS